MKLNLQNILTFIMFILLIGSYAYTRYINNKLEIEKRDGMTCFLSLYYKYVEPNPNITKCSQVPMGRLCSCIVYKKRESDFYKSMDRYWSK